MHIVSTKTAIATLMLAGALTGAGTAGAGVLYSQGFETNIAGWDSFGGALNATRVPSGTAGITSADGSFHAQSSGGTLNAGGSAGNWGGYNYGAGNAVPTVFQEYWTSVDVYLNVDGGWANDTRFDFSSAINTSAGTFLRDFVFNGGFYASTDVTGPGAGTNRFVFTASNGAGRPNSFPKNPARDPVAIDESGWYTFEHHFYDNGGILNVDLSIFEDDGDLVNTWTLGTDLIAGVGGNRYGWFARNEFSTLAFDNSELRTADPAAVPEPATLGLLAFGLAGFGLRRRKRA